MTSTTPKQETRSGPFGPPPDSLGVMADGSHPRFARPSRLAPPRRQVGRIPSSSPPLESLSRLSLNGWQVARTNQTKQRLGNRTSLAPSPTVLAPSPAAAAPRAASTTTPRPAPPAASAAAPSSTPGAPRDTPSASADAAPRGNAACHTSAGSDGPAGPVCTSVDTPNKAAFAPSGHRGSHRPLGSGFTSTGGSILVSA